MQSDHQSHLYGGEAVVAQVQLLQCGAGRQPCHGLQAIAEQRQPLQVCQAVINTTADRQVYEPLQEFCCPLHRSSALKRRPVFAVAVFTVPLDFVRIGAQPLTTSCLPETPGDCARAIAPAGR